MKNNEDLYNTFILNNRNNLTLVIAFFHWTNSVVAFTAKLSDSKVLWHYFTSYILEFSLRKHYLKDSASDAINYLKK